MDKILVTGSSGFIGYHVCKSLLEQGYHVVGIDNHNTYYDINLKILRRDLLLENSHYQFIEMDLCDKIGLRKLFETASISVVINLAAQAGVRYSLENPSAYIDSNIVGFSNILEMCRHFPVKHLIYASSSSVYGANDKVPFSEDDRVDNPVSLYAATKKSNELMAGTYSHLYKIPATGLRFFTVYGPMGRPDMAYYGFVDTYFRGDAINIFNNGNVEDDLYRDFTYIDDIVSGIIKLIDHTPTGNRKHEVYNIGNNSPVKLMEFISILESCLEYSMGRPVTFKRNYEPIKPGDVRATYADTSKLESAIGFKPNTPLNVGLQRFTNWYVEYHNIKTMEAD